MITTECSASMITSIRCFGLSLVAGSFTCAVIVMDGETMETIKILHATKTSELKTTELRIWTSPKYVGIIYQKMNLNAKYGRLLKAKAR
ncbi:hypothetical protein ACPBEI_05455 [Latilactobacillus sakei]